EVPAVRLGLACKRVLQVLLGLAAFKFHSENPPVQQQFCDESRWRPARFRLSLRDHDKVVLRPDTVNKPAERPRAGRTTVTAPPAAARARRFALTPAARVRYRGGLRRGHRTSHE